MTKTHITEIGAVCGVIGAALVAGAQVAPTPEIMAWLKFGGTILMGLGGTAVGFRVSKKLSGPKEPPAQS